jgi:hypothetical protein
MGAFLPFLTVTAGFTAVLAFLAWPAVRIPRLGLGRWAGRLRRGAGR